MEELLAQFEGREPEIVFEWNDLQTEAKGWLVINSLRGGAAGGGTRMRVGLTRTEVESLAKTMEVKFTVAGPAIGGAKSGIDFDPHDPRKQEVLERWFAAVRPFLKGCYGTGGDLNIDEMKEVIPITENNGLVHPQEGIITGHLALSDAKKIDVTSQLRRGVSSPVVARHLTPDPKHKHTVADLVTGYGVAESVRHFYNLWGGTVQDKRVVVQGWGNVGAATAFYLSSFGARIVAITDKTGGLINDEGFETDEIKRYMRTRAGNQLVAYNKRCTAYMEKRVWDLECEVFVPAAASRIVSEAQVQRLIRKGLELVACGANVPFADSEVFFGPITRYVDESVALIPDFIANCGMARIFAYLMGEGAMVTDEAMFDDVSDTIRSALEALYEKSPTPRLLTRSAFESALSQLVQPLSVEFH